MPVLFTMRDSEAGSEGRERLIDAISELWNDPVFQTA